jgi:hypothetical protein
MEPKSDRRRRTGCRVRRPVIESDLEVIVLTNGRREHGPNLVQKSPFTSWTGPTEFAQGTSPRRRTSLIDVDMRTFPGPDGADNHDAVVEEAPLGDSQPRRDRTRVRICGETAGHRRPGCALDVPDPRSRGRSGVGSLDTRG